MKKNIKLSNWAKMYDMSYRGAYNAFVKGQVPNSYKMPRTNTIMVVVDDECDKEELKTIIYARVSSSKQRPDVENQANRLTQYCMANGWSIDNTYIEIASGMNDKRPKLEKILELKTPIRLVVEHKDRLTRFGYRYIAHLVSNNGGEIHIVNNTVNDKEDIIQDFISVITSFCARIYGHRRTARKTKQIIEVLQSEDL